MCIFYVLCVALVYTTLLPEPMTFDRMGQGQRLPVDCEVLHS